MKVHTHKLKAFIASKSFFYIVVALFLFSSIWIALSSRYPMAFDENYHYGIIQQYSHQISPFFSHPPVSTEVFGDITRYPSYLFHYLMSFPYRFISVFTDSDVTKIILLRLINIALLCSSLFIFKKIFEKMRIGSGVGNLGLLLFVLTPVVPFLAAQINYDNLLIPLTALSILLFMIVTERLKQGRLDVKLGISVIILCLFTSLVKYTFLPIFAVLGIAGLVILFQEHKKHKLQIWKQVSKSFRALTGAVKVLLVAGLLISVGLFGERYGVNILKYKTPAPDCQQVLSEKSCLQYGPWARDYYLERGKTGPPSWNALRYSGHWTAQNMHELFFAIDQSYYEQAPLPMPYVGAWLFGALGLILMFVNWRKLRRLPHVNLVTSMIVFYIVVLWADNYHRFLAVNWPVAIHGRYLLPLLPLAYALLVYAYKVTLQDREYLEPVKMGLGAVAVLCMLQGGLVTYVVRSSESWYWQNGVVVRLNSATRRVLNSIVPH